MTSSAHAGPSSQSVKGQTWPPRLYLAVDCGGTKAAAAICDEYGQLIGKGRGGPSNFTDEGLHPFLNSVEDAVKDALNHVRLYYARTHEVSNGRLSNDAIDKRTECTISEALQAIKSPSAPTNSTPKQFQAAWFGIAGVDSPADVITLSPHLATLLNLPYPSERLIVANDTSLLASPITDSCRAGIQSGVVAIAGTGSIVMSFKRSSNGMLKVLGRVGGFGWLLGDEGSGYSVGRAAVRRVLDLADRERLARERRKVDSDTDDDGDDDDDDDDDEEEDRRPTTSSSGGDMDVTGIMSKDFLNTSTETMAKCNGGAEEEGNFKVSTTSTLGGADKSATFGQLLRDRILQDWNLFSTDELLRAVYFDDAPSYSSAFDCVPSIIRSGASPIKSLSLSDATLRSSSSTTSQIRTALPFTRAEASINLLPPIGLKIDEETRLRGHSPIPSLSSSPSDSNSSKAVSRNGQQARGISTQSSHNHSDSAVTTEVSSVASSFSNHESGTPRATSERKHRLASLTPLVFHLAFTHEDELCLEILRSQAHFIALQVCDILRPGIRAKAHLSSHSSVLCLGGALVGQEKYRGLLIEELQKLGVIFAAVEYVGDPATRGAMALSSVVEKRSSTNNVQ